MGITEWLQRIFSDLVQVYPSQTQVIRRTPTVFDIEQYSRSLYIDLGTLTTNNAVISGTYKKVPNDRYWIITHISVNHTYAGTSYHWYEVSKGDLTVHGYPLAGNASALQSPALLYENPLILYSGESIRPKLWSATVGDTGKFTAKVIEVFL